MKKERIAVIITICILCFAISAVFKTNEHSCIDIPIEQWYLRRRKYKYKMGRNVGRVFFS